MFGRRSAKDAGGPTWVALTYAPNQPLADLICNLLEDAQIPCYHRRAQGFDVPDFLAGGPRMVMVHPERLEDARAVVDPFDWQDAPGDDLAPNAR